MDQEKREKYQLLKEKNRAKVRDAKWKNNLLFKECIASLDDYSILSQDLPCVSCKLSRILNNIDDVLAVSFDTWLLSQNEREVIEFHHEGKIIYGKV